MTVTRPSEDVVEPEEDEFGQRIEQWYVTELEVFCDTDEEMKRVDDGMLAVLTAVPETKLIESEWSKDPGVPGGIGVFRFYPRVQGLITEIEKQLVGIEHDTVIYPASLPTII